MELLCIPGANGRGSFWNPVCAELTGVACRAIDWPGVGGSGFDPSVTDYPTLTDHVARRLKGPTAIAAQSMGGVVALELAIGSPKLVSHLVLTATSGGIDMNAVGAADWRTPDDRPTDRPDWVYDEVPDRSDQIAAIDIPTLLIWASDDEISPVAAGERLRDLIDGAQLHVIDSDSHWVVRDHPGVVAGLIQDFLTAG